MASTKGASTSTLLDVNIIDKNDAEAFLPDTFLVAQTVILKSDPATALSVAFEQGSDEHMPLIVFLNGLALPSTSFRHAIACFLRRLNFADVESDNGNKKRPALLTWDRYGQGASAKQDKLHDALDVVQTFDELLHTMGLFDKLKRPFILVANSIGGALARLFVQQFHPSYNVRGILFLDSIMANSDLVSPFNEDRQAFQKDGLDEEERAKERIALEHAREVMRATFHPSCPNAEGFNRMNLADQLPFSDKPKLENDPFITVLGHDHMFFAQDTERRLGIPADLVHKYYNSAWDEYNNGLARLSSPEHVRGPLRPPNSGHFIQVSRPDFVADELYRLYSLVLQEQDDAKAS